MGLLLAIETIKSTLFSLQVFIPSTWCQENVAVYYKALVKKCALIAIFPDKHYQFKWKKLKSSFEIRLYTFVFFVFFHINFNFNHINFMSPQYYQMVDVWEWNES